jgi:hypothetical protein
MSIVSSELNFSDKGKAAVHSSVRKLSIVPASGSNNVTLAPSGTVNTKFYFGSQSNFMGEKTSLKGVIRINGLASNTTVVHTQPAMCVQNISLTSSSGAPIVQVQDVNAFLRMSSGALTSHEKFLTNDSNGSAATDGPAYQLGAGPMFARNNVVGSNAAGAGARGPVVPGGSNTGARTAYTEQKYQVASAIGADTVIPFEFDFSLFKETYLSNSKLNYTPQDYILSIDWISVANLGYQALSTTATATTAIIGPVVITDLQLILAVEANVELAEAKMQQVRTSGSRTLIPYLTAVTNAHGPNTNPSYSLPLNRSFGSSLLAIYVECHNSVTSGNLATDISNVGQVKVLTQQTKFNNSNLSENRLDCAKNEDYQHIKHLFKDSVVNDADVWNFSRCYIDSWRANEAHTWSEANENGIADGVSLTDQSMSWQISLTTPGVTGLLERYWIVTQREMTVDSSGQTMVV